MTATKDEELIGYAYGCTLQPNSRWWDGLQTPVPEGFTAEDNHHTFAISEIMARAPRRRREFGSFLHSSLLVDRSEEQVTLLVESGNDLARWAYSQLGLPSDGRAPPELE